MFESRGKLALIKKEAERIICVGDLHGDLYAFNSVKEIFRPERDLIVFLGDYADRGKNSVEVIEGVKELMKNYSKQVIALKGNHEDYSENGEPKFYPCTLIPEVERKIGDWSLYFKEFRKDFLNKLYITAKIEDSVLFVHAGVSKKIKNEADLINPSKSVEEDLIWSDPHEGENEYPNPRGAGILYGKDVSQEVCKRLNIKYIIRSHEPAKAFVAPCIEHDGRVITISSTSVYGGRPFVLILPTKNIPKSNEIEKYVTFL